MCVPPSYRSLHGLDIDAIYDYIKTKTILCKYIQEKSFRRWMVTQAGSLRKKCKKQESFETIWNLVLQYSKERKMYNEILKEVLPGGGFLEFLTAKDILKKISPQQRGVTAELNLCFHLGLLALDLAAMKGELSDSRDAN